MKMWKLIRNTIIFQFSQTILLWKPGHSAPKSATEVFLDFFFLLWMSLKLVGMSAMTFSNAVSLEMTFLIKPKFTHSLWNFTKSYFEVIFTVCFFVSSGLHMASSLISLTATKRPRAWFHLQNLLFQMGFDVLIAIKAIKRKGLKKIRHHHRKQCKNSLRQQNC